MSKRILLLLVVLLAIFVVIPAYGVQTWTLASSWSKTSGSNNCWTYGYRNLATNTFTPYNVFYTATSGGSTEDRWGMTTGNFWEKGHAIMATGPNPMVDWGRRSEIGFVNSLVPWDGSCQFVAKWTAPTAGVYSISALFTAQKYAVIFTRPETHARLFVMKVATNGTVTYLNPNGQTGEELWGFYGSLPNRTDAFGNKQSYSYSGTISLNAGESIFLANQNCNDWDYDAVGISASVTSTLNQSAWLDSYYPYRVAFSTTFPSAGDYQLSSLTSSFITDCINEKNIISFNPNYFAYDNVKLVEIDSSGNVINANVNAGFEKTLGAELVTNGGFENGTTGWSFDNPSYFTISNGSYNGTYCMVTQGADRNACYQLINVSANTYYQFSSWALAAQADVFYYPAGGWWQFFNDCSYYDPYISGSTWRHVQYYIYTGSKSNWANSNVEVRQERYTGAVDDLSLKQCTINFDIRGVSAGTHYYLLYYAPLEGVKVTVPSTTTASFPASSVSQTRQSITESIDEQETFKVGTQLNIGDLWSALPTRKLLASTPSPYISRSQVAIDCAKGESEAIQLVFRPKGTGTIQSVSATATGPGGATLSGSDFDIRTPKYVSISTPSTPFRTSFTGALPDPLPKFSSISFQAGDSNILIWLDVTVQTNKPAGVYTGSVSIQTTGGTVSVPIQITVRNFTLPSSPTCMSSFQLARYGNYYLFPFHKVTTLIDQYDLSRNYIAEMARYKMAETYGTMSAYANYPYTPPIDPYPEWYTQCPWLFDQLYDGSNCVLHKSGNIFRGTTVQTWQPEAADWNTKCQYLFNHQAADGQTWLSKSYIMIDEPQPADYDGLRNYVTAFAQQPYAYWLPMLVCTYYGDSYEQLGGWVEHLAVSNDDQISNVASPSAIGSIPSGHDAWLYWVTTCHRNIDAPGIDNRFLGPKTWAMGAKGTLSWLILQWWTESGGDTFYNPWVNPYSVYGNGVGSYFYPPNPAGIDLPSKDMTIVPSLRMVNFRDGIEDYDYAAILKAQIARVNGLGQDTTQAQIALDNLSRPFVTPVNWAVSEVYWKQARTAAALAIEDLQSR